MNRFTAFCFLLFTGQVALASPGQSKDADNFAEDRMEKEQVKMIQERMEEEPSSTSVGGSRGGQLEAERRRDDKRAYDLEKQRKLYESENRYRRGL